MSLMEKVIGWVPQTGVITVYPKDGGEARKASFVQSFDEEDIRSANVRYFFPDGCGIAKSEVDIPPIEKKDDVIEVPETTELPEETTTEELTTTTTTTEVPVQAAQIHVPQSPAISIKLEIVLPTNVYNYKPFTPYKHFARKCSEKCCNEKDSSKIVIPIDKAMIEKMDTEEILQLSNETNNIKMVEKLLKFVEKSKA